MSAGLPALMTRSWRCMRAHECARDVLGLWIENTEGTKFWMRMSNELKTRGQFPTDEAALKLLWLAIRNISTKWGSSTRYWSAAMQ